MEKVDIYKELINLYENLFACKKGSLEYRKINYAIKTLKNLIDDKIDENTIKEILLEYTAFLLDNEMFEEYISTEMLINKYMEHYNEYHK